MRNFDNSKPGDGKGRGVQQQQKVDPQQSLKKIVDNIYKTDDALIKMSQNITTIRQKLNRGVFNTLQQGDPGPAVLKALSEAKALQSSLPKAYEADKVDQYLKKTIDLLESLSRQD
jgi:hypothetical protein